MTAVTPPTESLIQYPSQFPIKVMGVKVDGLVHAISVIAHAFDPTFNAASIELPLARLLRRGVPGVRVLGHSEIPDARTIRVSVMVGGKR